MANRLRGLRDIFAVRVAVPEASSSGGSVPTGTGFRHVTGGVEDAAAATLAAADIASGTIAAGRMPALTGDVTSSVGTVATTIATNVVTNAKLAQIATQRIRGRTTAATGNVEDLTVAQVTAMLDAFVASGAGHLKGLVPDPGVTAGTTKYLREDGTWVNPTTNVNTAPTAFTPTITATVTNPTKGATRVETCTYWRSGQWMYIDYQYQQSSGGAGGTAGSGTYLFLVPGGETIDSGVIKLGTMASATTTAQAVGHAQLHQSGSAATVGEVFAYDSTHFAIWGSSGSGVGSAFYQLSAANISHSFQARIPIVGWT